MMTRYLGAPDILLKIKQQRRKGRQERNIICALAPLRWTLGSLEIEPQRRNDAKKEILFAP
jgi:hypothetical protein